MGIIKNFILSLCVIGLLGCGQQTFEPTNVDTSSKFVFSTQKAVIPPVQMNTVFDNFDDGNANGWLMTAPSSLPEREPATWRVEGNRVINTPLLTSGDAYKFLLNGYTLSNQSVEAKVLFYGSSGYGGVSLWHKDLDNWIDVLIYPARGFLAVGELIDRVGVSQTYPFASGEFKWYTLRVDANSSAGTLAIYVNDVYILTHIVSTPNRSGLSGFNSGNSGGEFDDFQVTSKDIPLNVDIQPRDNQNKINIKGTKKISVAVLATSTFSPFNEIDTSTLTFGVTGDEKSVTGCTAKPKDVNTDRLKDLKCSVSVNKTGFKCGDTTGILKGTFKSTGVSFQNSQKITITGCK